MELVLKYHEPAPNAAFVAHLSKRVARWPQPTGRGSASPTSSHTPAASTGAKRCETRHLPSHPVPRRCWSHEEDVKGIRGKQADADGKDFRKYPLARGAVMSAYIARVLSVRDCGWNSCWDWNAPSAGLPPAPPPTLLSSPPLHFTPHSHAASDIPLL